MKQSFASAQSKYEKAVGNFSELENNSSKASEYGEKGKEFAIENFDRKKIAKQLLDRIRKLNSE